MSEIEEVAVTQTDAGPNQSATIGALAKALSVAQGTMCGALKDSANPFFKSKYADLTSVWEAIRKPLSINGLAVVQTTERSATSVVICTTLIHASGEWIRGHLEFPFGPKSDPQSIGSMITYARRYALAAICGVAPEDDDAEGAMGRSQPKQETKTSSTSFEAANVALKDRWMDAVKRTPFAGPVDDEIVIRAMELCENTADLADIWRTMPEDQRKRLAAEKDKAKDRLAEAV